MKFIRVFFSSIPTLFEHDKENIIHHKWLDHNSCFVFFIRQDPNSMGKGWAKRQSKRGSDLLLMRVRTKRQKGNYERSPSTIKMEPAKRPAITIL